MKLLVINLRVPSKSTYLNPKHVEVFMLGKDLENYRLFSLNDNGGLYPIVLRNVDPPDIQKTVDAVFRDAHKDG